MIQYLFRHIPHTKIPNLILFVISVILFTSGAQVKQQPGNVAAFSDDLTAIFILGGDQTITTLTATGTSTPQSISPSATSTQRKVATRTPRPTKTPAVIPPPADPVRSNWMIAIAILAVIVVFIGLWINWRRVS
jgi:hypothetical protein